MTPTSPVSLDRVEKMGPSGTLSRLDNNILLLHLAPLLGLDASLSLAATSHFYRKLLLHHTLGHHTIPSGYQLTTSFPPGALAAIRNINVEPATGQRDIQWILWGTKLPALKSMTISHTPDRYHHLIAVGELGLRRLHRLTIECFTASEFLTNRHSAGTLHSLRRLTIVHKCSEYRQCTWPLPAHLLRALGPHSKLTSLEISWYNALYSSHYHTAVLALLTALSQPGLAPPNLSLLSLSFPKGRHRESNGLSVIVSARKSSLANPKSGWRLGRLLYPNFSRTEGIWNHPGYFMLTEAELDAIIALDEKSCHSSNLSDFFAGPVIFHSTALRHAGRLGTALQGIEIDMSLHQISPSFYPSLTCIVLNFVVGEPVCVDPMPWVRAAAPYLKSIELRTITRDSSIASEGHMVQQVIHPPTMPNLTMMRTVTRDKRIPFAGPRVHGLLNLQTMPKLTILRIDIRLLLAVGGHQKCGPTKESHTAARYQFGWIPAVSRLRLDYWNGCSGCWTDCNDGTLRHFDRNWAGGAGTVTVTGEFDLCVEEEPQFGMLWDVVLYRAME